MIFSILYSTWLGNANDPEIGLPQGTHQSIFEVTVGRTHNLFSMRVHGFIAIQDKRCSWALHKKLDEHICDL